jgi:hypothetical protein
MLTLETFSDFLHARAEQFRRELAAEAIEFVVGVENGRVRFTARPATDEPA